ncbi:MAG TPA: histidine phosphatase family protein [Gaiellaceae bacterium]
MRTFLLVRHGQSLFNVEGIVNGDPSRDRGLSARGIEEAERLAGQIANVAIDLVVVSTFPRAIQTAELALAGRVVPRELDPGLGDIRIGELEGRTLADYRASGPHADRSLPFPGGESLADAARRFAAAFGRLCDRGEETTLVVCHEIPVRYAVNAAGDSNELDAPLHDVANATPYLFDEPALRRAAARLVDLAG